MKIAILSPKKYEEAETFIQNHIKNLPFNVVVIYGGNLPFIADNHLPTNRSKRLHQLKRKLGLTSLTYKESQLTCILKYEKVDAVFAEYLITGAETVGVCKDLNVPLIAIALGYEISMYHIIEHYKTKYCELFQYANNILVVSQHMRVNIEKLSCPKEKIIYSPAGPASDFFEIQPSFIKKQVLAIGRFVDKKAPHLSILAFKKVVDQIPEAVFVMAGEGPLLNACKDLVRAIGIEGSVNFVGRIDREQHKILLNESTVFIQHSKVAENGDSEGTPVAILEASAAGLPIVSTLHAGIPDIVIDGKTGFLVPENDVDLMSKKMIELLLDKEKAIEFGENGRQYVSENFSLEKHIEIISKYIKSI